MALVLLVASILVVQRTLIKTNVATFLDTSTDTIPVGLEEYFTLREGQFALVTGEDLLVGIAGFIYSPCPEDVQCIWSGLGVELEYRYKGQVEKGINLTQAFGYQVEIVDTDYQTFTDLIVTKLKSGL